MATSMIRTQYQIRMDSMAANTRQKASTIRMDLAVYTKMTTHTVFMVQAGLLLMNSKYFEKIVAP